MMFVVLAAIFPALAQASVLSHFRHGTVAELPCPLCVLGCAMLARGGGAPSLQAGGGLSIHQR